MWLETTEQVCNMMAMDPYPGYQGKYFSMPVRNVVPKPVQKPHPPLWVACSNRDTIHLAAQLGIGALTFAFVDPAEAKKWVDDYYETFKRECVPIGHTVNPNIAMVTSFSIHHDREEAFRRGFDGFKFFQFGLGHHYVFGHHKPGRTNIWANYERVKAAMGAEQLDFLGGGTDGIGTPDDLRQHLRKFAEAGVDQTVFIQQGGKNRHEHICEALELFAAEVMPEFKEEEERRQRQKMDELAPYIEKALARKQRMRELTDDEIPTYAAYGAMIAEVDTSNLEGAARIRAERWRKMREVLSQV
jgi:alkanesulfonate monooxygenase SsuD/methylene tetrahydromethanopterin reductase-like flavin-dependent oxidoreductase (luciferase family)